MASKYADSVKGKAGYRVQFVPHGVTDRARKVSIWLSEYSEREAEAVKEHIEHMLEQLADGRPYCKATQVWLDGTSSKSHTRLSNLGFCEPRITQIVEETGEPARTLEMLCDRFARTIGSKKPATQTKLLQAIDCLKRFPGFGAAKVLSEITPGDAEEWRTWLLTDGNIREGKVRKDERGKPFRGRKELAENTVRRRSGLAKQIFAFGIKLKWIQENPFSCLVASVNANVKRQFFVDRKTITAVIEAAPDEHWKAIIAMARYGGVRIPSEIAGLRWMDVDFEANRIRVYSPKTEHHEGRSVRWCPLFPELRIYLVALAAVANPGIETPLSAKLFHGCERATNLRTHFLRILKRAGVEPWPKLFQNLRASCETELLQTHSAKDVCSWIGNTKAVAMEHYAMATDAIFERATRVLSGDDPASFAKKDGQKDGQSLPESTPQEAAEGETRIEETNEKTAESTGKQALCGFMSFEEGEQEWAVLDPNNCTNRLRFANRRGVPEINVSKKISKHDKPASKSWNLCLREFATTTKTRLPKIANKF